MIALRFPEGDDTVYISTMWMVVGCHLIMTCLQCWWAIWITNWVHNYLVMLMGLWEQRYFRIGMALHWVDLIKSHEEEEEAHNFHKWQWMTYLYSLMMSTEIRIIRNERHDWSTLRSLLQGRELLWIPWINSIGHDWIAMRTIISTTGKVLANKMVKLTGTTEICTSDWLCILYRMVSSGSDCLTENWLHFCDMYYASERGRSKSYIDIWS